MEKLGQAGIKNYPELLAALNTSRREFLAATQLVEGARQALLGKRFRQAEDLARRALQILESSGAKLNLVRQVGEEFSLAPQQASQALEESLRELSQAKTLLAGQAEVLDQEPNAFLLPALQKIGEARRAIKATPPQYSLCLRLSKEAVLLLKETVGKVGSEIERLKNARTGARSALHQMEEAVQLARLTLNNQQQVPVRANELYRQARQERDNLNQRGQHLEMLKAPPLEKIIEEAWQALKKAQEATRLAQETALN